MIEDSFDDDDEEPPHDLIDSSSDEDTPTVPLAIARQKSLRKRRVDLPRCNDSPVLHFGQNINPKPELLPAKRPRKVDFDWS